jgi:alpha-maltose-1-phosphate synthase
MRIIVSHNAKQHSAELLKPLFYKKMLINFITGFSANKLDNTIDFMPKMIKKALKKRYFAGIPATLITQNFFTYLGEYFFRKSTFIIYKYIYTSFDSFAANCIINKSFDVVISYENVNLKTFKIAKLKSSLTILDLAGIHHQRSSQLKQQYGIGDPAETAELLAWINARKEQAYQFTDYVFTLSAYAKETLLEGGISADRIYLLTLGVNLQNFAPKTVYPQSGTFKLLYVGAMVRAKGLETLLKAWIDLNLPAAELMLIGGGSTNIDFLKPFMGHYQHIPHLDHQSLANAYREANVFVSPSYLDSWAQTVIEALACGTPVITTENTGAKDAVLQGGGLVIPAGDEDALKKSILYFYNNREQIEIMGRKGRQIAEQYTWENYHQQVIAAVEDIARRENIPLS